MIDEQTQDAIREGVAAAVKEHQKGQPTAEHGQPHHGPYLVLSLEQIAIVRRAVAAVGAVSSSPAETLDIVARCDAALGAHPSWREPHE